MTASAPVPVKRAAPAPTASSSVFSALQREVDRLFDDFARTTWSPFSSNGAFGAVVKMDVAETKDGIELTAELPGLEEKDVEVTLSDRMLTISGEKQADKEEKQKNYYFAERSYGAFSRSIELPADIDAGKIKAVITNGVLKVSLPRTAKAEAKKIEVKTAA